MAETGSVFRDHRILVRVIYVTYAALWWYLNKNNVILSQWDAERIGVPVLWYMTIPAVSLILYAVFPNKIVWLFPAAILAIGWTLHVKESLFFLYAHMNVKTDWEFTSIFGLFNLIGLAVCLTVLYLTGPYIQKRLQGKNIA